MRGRDLSDRDRRETAVDLGAGLPQAPGAGALHGNAEGLLGQTPVMKERSGRPVESRSRP